MYTRVQECLRAQRLSKRVVAKRLGMQYRVFLRKVSGVQHFTLDEAVQMKKMMRTHKSVEELFEQSA